MKSLRQKPPLTIAIPVFNGMQFISETIESILKQTYSDFILIIIDNASVDETKTICLRYAAKDSRIVLHRQPKNVGASANFNQAFALCQTQFFKWHASDDLLGPDFVGKAMKILLTEPDVALATCATKKIAADGSLIEYYPNPLTRHANSSPATRFIDFAHAYHSCFEVFGIFRANILSKTRLIQAYTGSDRTLLAEIALHGKIRIDDSHEFISRQHKGQSVNIPLQYRSGWFDPNRDGTFTFAHHRIWGEYWRTLVRGPGTWKTKAECSLFLIIYPFSSKIYYRQLVMELWQFVTFKAGMTNSHGERNASKLWDWVARVKRVKSFIAR